MNSQTKSFLSFMTLTIVLGLNLIRINKKSKEI